MTPLQSRRVSRESAENGIEAEYWVVVGNVQGKIHCLSRKQRVVAKYENVRMNGGSVHTYDQELQRDVHPSVQDEREERVKASAV